MKVDTIVTDRIFTLKDITEKEMIVLCEMINLSEDKIRERIKADCDAWNDRMTEDEAVEIGTTMREKVFAAIYIK